MPYGLFDYIPDSTIHTMGLSPLPNPQFRGTSPMDTTLMMNRNPDGSITMSRGLGTTPYYTPTTLMAPEDPTQRMPTTAALYEEGNVPPTRPPGGGGGGKTSCPPGYSPSPSVEPVRPAPAPVPNPTPKQGTQNWGAYNPVTKSMLGNEDARNYSAAEVQQAIQQFRNPSTFSEVLNTYGINNPNVMNQAAQRGISFETPAGL